MTLKLYFDLLSQPSRALYIFLNKCNVPYEEKYIKLRNMQHMTPEFEKINPLKKIPVIEHNGFLLSESIAIVRYIAREFKIPENWYPSSSKEQAKVDEFLEWQHLNIRFYCATYFVTTVLQPMFTGVKPDSSKVVKIEKNMLKGIDLLENVWLKDKPFLTGSEISVADLFATCELEQVRACGYEPKEGRPRVSAWMEMVAKETSPFYDKAHQSIWKLKAATGQRQKSKL